MLNKIYLVLLGIALVVMLFFTYYSWSWLQSIGSPLAIVENYEFFGGMSWLFLWISSAVLLAVANAILWTYRRAWAMWITLAYFILFVVIKYFWLDQTFFAFKKANGFTDATFSGAIFFAVIFCLAAGAIVFFDQFIVLRLSDRMHSRTIPAEVVDVGDEP